MPDAGRFALLRRPLAVGFVLIVLYGVLRGLYALSDVVLLSFLAVLFATLFTFPIDFLAKRIPHGVAVVVTIVGVVGLLVFVGAMVVPLVARQGQDLLKAVPHMLERAHDTWSRTLHVPQASTQAAAAKAVPEPLTAVGKLLPAATTTLETLTEMVLVLVMAFFFAARPETYRGALLELVPRSHEAVVSESLLRLGTTLRHWMGGILVAMVLMGTFTTIGLWIAGIDGWLLLGFLTFLGTFVPYAGALASAVPGLLVALAQSPASFGWALLVYTLVHVIEGYLVQPIIMRRAVHLHPALLLFWQAAMLTLFGVPGVLVATPLLACVQVVVGYLWIERRLGKVAPTT